MKKVKSGISLIVLIITIIVVVILATTVILTVAKNNPIKNAQDAVEENNKKVAMEKLQLALLDYEIEKNQSGITLEEYLKKIQNDGTIDSFKKNTEGKIRVSCNGYLFEINGDTLGVKLIENEPNFVIETLVSDTTISVHIKDAQFLKEDREYTYSIKEQSAENYINEITTKEENYEFTNLTIGKVYTISVKTKTNKDADISKEVDVLIPVKVIGVKFNTSSIIMKSNGTYTLSATVEPENASNKELIWESSNPEVVSVVDGVLTSYDTLQKDITITAKSAENNEFYASCSVEVAEAKPLKDVAKGSYVNYPVSYTNDGTGMYGKGNISTYTGWRVLYSEENTTYIVMAGAKKIGSGNGYKDNASGWITYMGTFVKDQNFLDNSYAVNARAINKSDLMKWNNNSSISIRDEFTDSIIANGSCYWLATVEQDQTFGGCVAVITPTPISDLKSSYYSFHPLPNSDIYGYRAIIQLKDNMQYVGGKGTASEPYVLLPQ